ncbi:MAG: glycosyltransferase [Hydrogenophaga sp.]|uniref:glycosyltransferase n=1 Tax=Hydrogenophaga sp. TaxID=1904254 RepID=UPI002614DDAF|nr:glycosyltransferase [Hydrogenophaga sp.]MDM7943740.1 glycosyltransferase [Hydrogenophaga sp.]
MAAVVTTFHGGDGLRSHLERIADQVEVVIIVDDSGDPLRNDAITFTGMEKTIVLRNEDNLGIAAALNRGIARAGAMGCDWIITLDDDTLVSRTYLDDVFSFVQTGAQPTAGLIACSREGSVPSSQGDPAGYKIKRTLITSGCVFEFRTFQEIGGFDEDLFIDLVDFDFCTKLRQSGRTLVLLNKTGMAHRVGNARKVCLLGVAIVIYNHAPFRLHYQVRNVFLFARKHLAFDPVLSLYLLLDAIRLPLKALLFEPQKRARLFYVCTGLQDGLLGRGGRLTRRFVESS